jgi:hypothetical protein
LEMILQFLTFDTAKNLKHLEKQFSRHFYKILKAA